MTGHVHKKTASSNFFGFHIVHIECVPPAALSRTLGWLELPVAAWVLSK